MGKLTKPVTATLRRALLDAAGDDRLRYADAILPGVTAAIDAVERDPTQSSRFPADVVAEAARHVTDTARAALAADGRKTVLQALEEIATSRPLAPPAPLRTLDLRRYLTSAKVLAACRRHKVTFDETLARHCVTLDANASGSDRMQGLGSATAANVVADLAHLGLITVAAGDILATRIQTWMLAQLTERGLVSAAGLLACCEPGRVSAGTAADLIAAHPVAEARRTVAACAPVAAGRGVRAQTLKLIMDPVLDDVVRRRWLAVMSPHALFRALPDPVLAGVEADIVTSIVDQCLHDDDRWMARELFKHPGPFSPAQRAVLSQVAGHANAGEVLAGRGSPAEVLALAEYLVAHAGGPDGLRVALSLLADGHRVDEAAETGRLICHTDG